MAINTDITKNILTDSLRDVLKEKPFKSITVNDIVMNCGASRSTFYRYFKDKYEIMNWIYKKEIDELIKKYPGKEGYELFKLEGIYNMKENLEYFSQIIKFHGQNSFHEFLYDYIFQYFKEQIIGSKEIEELPEDVLFSLKFYCAGSVFIAEKWLNSDLEYSPEKLSQLLRDNIPPSLKKFIE